MILTYLTTYSKKLSQNLISQNKISECFSLKRDVSYQRKLKRAKNFVRPALACTILVPYYGLTNQINTKPQ